MVVLKNKKIRIKRVNIDINIIINYYHDGFSTQKIAKMIGCNKGTIASRLKSSGIKLRNVKKHNLTNTRLYRIWINMKTRCYNSNNKNYKNYGGRGIKICDEWLGKDGFQNFYDWAINNDYKINLTINRINNDGMYEPNNCNWATMKEQGNNTSRNYFLTFNNKTQTLKQWSEELKISSQTLHNRIGRLKWSIERTFTTKKRD